MEAAKKVFFSGPTTKAFPPTPLGLVVQKFNNFPLKKFIYSIFAGFLVDGGQPPPPLADFFAKKAIFFLYALKERYLHQNLDSVWGLN